MEVTHAFLRGVRSIEHLLAGNDRSVLLDAIDWNNANGEMICGV